MESSSTRLPAGTVMPIHYRCQSCEQLLSISTRKAGLSIPCPLCGEISIVPFPDNALATPIDQSEVPPFDSEDNPARESPPPQGRQPIDFQLRPMPDLTASVDEYGASRPAAPDQDKAGKPTSPQAVHRNEDESDGSDPDPESLVVSRSETVEPAEDAGGIQLRRSSPVLGELDLTSMVDVTFLLLIFFMVTASFSLQKTIELPPPNPDQKGAVQSLTLEDLQANTIFVKVDAANQIYIDDVPAGDSTRLEQALTQARLSTLRTEVAIDADPECRHETVVQVIDAATGAGMQKVRIVSRPSTLD